MKPRHTASFVASEPVCLPRRRVVSALAATLVLGGCASGLSGAGSATRAGQVKVQWFGQAAFKFTSVDGKVIVIDPWLTTNPKTPAQYKNLEALGKVDLILVTHGHGDHFGDVVALAKLTNAPVWGPAGLSQSMQTLGLLPPAQALRMGKGGNIMPLGPGIRITMVRAEHSAELVWRNPATGKDETHVGGEPCGFVIQFENGYRIYHTGDTGLFGDLRLYGDLYKPDLLLLPIGGGQFVMNPADAAIATREMVRPKVAVPMHYLTNPTLPGTPEEYLQAMAGSSTSVIVMQPGETRDF